MKTLLCLLLLTTTLAHAWVPTTTGSGTAAFWKQSNSSAPANVINPNTGAIRYFMASDAFSAANREAELNAIRASFGQWQSIPNTSLRFEEGGLVTPQVDMINSSDGTNIIYWVKQSNLINGGRSSILGVLGLTFITLQSDGQLIGADIALNAREAVPWYTDFEDKLRPEYFVESTVLHEIGHFLGLEHTPMGGATMFAYARTGVDAASGLSADELAFARTTYPANNVLSTLGTLAGQVTMNGAPVFGAVVLLENAATGVLIGGTVTGANGNYRLAGYPPGNYQVRAWPLDPNNAGEFLIRGWEINGDYANATTNFLPTQNFPVTLPIGGATALNISVTTGNPAFRIAYLRIPTVEPISIIGTPVVLPAGRSNATVGVYGAGLPTSGATLSVTGDGITLGATTYDNRVSYSGLVGINATIHVASNATPGPRTILITQGANRAYANGFLDITSPAPDDNYDGLSDVFQRRHFSVFTSAQAAPGNDPDGDGLNNAAEAVAGTNPTDPNSVLKINSTTTTASGTTVRWRSVAGRRYQLMGKAFVTSAWVNVGGPVTGGGSETSQLDAGATSGAKFYRVQVLP